MYSANYNVNKHALEIFRNGAYWFSIPVSVSINNILYSPEQFSRQDSVLRFASDDAVLSFTLNPDSIKVDFSVSFSENTAIYDALYFRSSAGGLGISHFDRAFSP